MTQLVWLVPALPLAGFLINGLFRNQLSKSLTGIIGSGTVLGAFVVSLLIFGEVRQEGFQPVVVTLFDFISVGKLSIPFAFQVDSLSALFLLIITGVGFLIHLYSTAYMHEENAPQFARYFSYLNLFVFSMLLLVLGANFIILFIGWEGVGLCSYLLIGYWFQNTDYDDAARKAFIMNRIGDVAFLIAIFYMVNKFGSVSFDEVFGKASTLSTGAATVITLLLFVGATGKSAQIPLYTWLPDAMAGPTPVSALIHAATMVTAGIYMIARSHVLYDLAPVTQTVVAVIGLATALLAATIALKQNDIKKVLAYSTVSQLGYMFLGLGVGAYTGAVFHVMTHAFFKALLFLGAGSVIHAMGGEQDIRKMGGLRKALPQTTGTFFIGCIAIAGIPPFAGFFSKDEILTAAYAKNPVYYAVGVFTALLTAFYMFRLFAMTFGGKFRGTHEQEHHLHESPAAMTIPLWVLAILSVVGGFVGIPAVIAPNAHWLAKFLGPVVGEGTGAELASGTEWGLIATSVVLALIGSIGAWARFSKKPELGEPTGFGKVLANKWYVDEFYNAMIVRPLDLLAQFLVFFDKNIVDGIVNGVGRLVQYGSRQLRLLQSGQVGGYVLLMVLGILILFLVELFSGGSGTVTKAVVGH
ncbi:NADH-quinone oxidoreductase subunit L [Puia dinghuensis]|uniref:NADH dehydrogenase subunit L n=1 Tax=Puia dinghuensis TaxID=1792502 RepID=A0A8J2UHK6_9BACT|nr:NADH-quinone oxidoreductase subunit L [Puia dinghuensis]GGB18981.1 NADH dehydrogenase subunit L [Puia dinghuensis]